MKVFLSYRRDDTGGRSGRLFDSLADALGARNVFQDVATLAPGRDFAEQVAAAIAASDAVLVVIGPGWFGAAAGGEPGRRLDRPDDPVRQEVAQALASEIPVVPVLVDGATLPAETELPPDLVALTRRQAVTLSDASWRADVGELLRRLKGEPPPRARRRRVVALGVGVGALVLAGIVIAAAVRDDGGGSSDSTPPCVIDDAWDERTLVAEPTAEMTEEQSRIGFAVRRAVSRSAPRGAVDVVVEVAATDLTPPDAVDPNEPDAPYFGSEWIEGLLVDGVLQAEIACWGPVAGDPQLAPGRTAIVPMGFDSSLDPAGGALALAVATDTDEATVPVTAG